MTNKVPNIRFKGFTDDWEQRKLGDVFDERSERASGNEELLSVTISNGVIRQIDSEKRNIASEDKSNYKVVKKGDVPYNSMRMWQGAVGTSDYDGIVSPAYTVLIPKNNCDGKFFMELFNKQLTLENFKRWSQGLTSDTWNLKYPVLSTIPFMVPSVKEQEKIAEYFKSLDNLITLHQRKCEQTKELKKFMLQKMFPKKGEKNPEIRFPGFTDDWEQRKLMSIIRNIIDFRGRTPKKLGLDWSDNGYLALSALNVKNGYIDFSQDAHYGNQELYDRWMSGKELYKNQVLFTTEAPMGNVAQVPDNKGYILSQRTIAFEVNEEYIIDDFLAIVLRSPVVFSDLTALSSGGTAKGVSQRTLNSLDFTIPKDIIEQTKIANYFKSLDHLITLHQRKCEQLKELKKFMLQNMFPKKG